MKRITLLYPHTHDGVEHASGVTLCVPDHVAEWLLDHRIAILSRNQAGIRNTPAESASPDAGAPASGAALAATEPPQPQSADTAKPEIDHDPAS